MKKLLLLVSVALVGVIASCKKDNPKPLQLTAITLSKDTVSLNVGDTKSIAFTLNPSNYDKSQLVWRSSDNTIATVDNTGAVNGIKEGNVIITVTNQDGTVTSTCLVSVLPQLKGIKMVKDTLIMHAGDTKTVGVTLTPANSSSNTLVWYSSDTTVLKVNAGLITAKKQGQAIVSVASQDGTLTTFCLVTVIPAIEDISIGLIAYYPFNFDSAVDSSGNGNDGVIYNMTSVPDRFGKPNAAYYFNGTNSYIDVKDKPALRLNNTDFTINAWVNLDSYNASYGSFLLSKRTAGIADGWGFSVTGYQFQSSGQGNLGLGYFGPGGGNPSSLSNTPVQVNHWAMITVTYNNTLHEVKFYINGVLDNTVENIDSPNAQITADMYIGGDNPANPTSYLVKGKIDDIRIYSRQLNAATVQKLYNLPY